MDILRRRSRRKTPPPASKEPTPLTIADTNTFRFCRSADTKSPPRPPDSPPCWPSRSKSQLPQSDPDRRSISCAIAPLRVGAQVVSQRRGESETLIRTHQRRLLDKEKIKKLGARFAPSTPPIRRWRRRFASKLTTLKTTRSRCGIPSSAASICLWARADRGGMQTVIGSRLKQSGMFWTVRRATAILALRYCHLNRRFEDYWRRARRRDLHFHRRTPYSGRIPSQSHGRTVKLESTPAVSLTLWPRKPG
jgi:hypothetical protein